MIASGQISTPPIAAPRFVSTDNFYSKIKSIRPNGPEVHNHPSGDPKPSGADVAVTREIVAAAETLNLKVHDHLVIGKHGHASLKQLGLM